MPTKKVFVTLGLIFSVLALVGLFNWYTSAQLQHSFGSVSHIHQVRANLTRLLAAVQDVQMGQRGYVLSGEQRFLVPYTFGIQQIQAQFDRLLHLTVGNSSQQGRLNALKPLLDQMLADARDTIALRDTAGFEAAQREVASGKSQEMTDTIRLAIQEMDQEEGALLVKRSDAAGKAADLNLRALVASPVVSFVFLAIACLLFLREKDRRFAAENESRTKMVMLHSVLHSIGDGVAVADPNGKFLVLSPAAEEILGTGAADPTSADSQPRWFLPDQATPFPADQLPVPRAVRGECVSNLDMFVRNPNRPEGWPLSVTARPLLSDGGTVMGAVVVFHDRSRGKSAEVRLAKIDQPFVGKDQKTPPKPDKPLVEVHPKPVEVARPEVDEPLFKKRQDAPRETVKLSLRPQSLNALIEQVVTMLAPAADLQQITLSQQLAPDLPDLPLDDNRISEVLVNLLTNALKYTPFGGNILVTSGRPSPEKVQVSVIDNGCGISVEQCERIFKSPQKKSGETTSGVGTGLSNCRQLVELHGGQIWVRSELQRGSTFTFSLPTRGAAASTVRTSQNPVANTSVPSHDEVDQFSWKRKDKAA